MRAAADLAMRSGSWRGQEFNFARRRTRLAEQGQFRAAQREGDRSQWRRSESRPAVAKPAVARSRSSAQAPSTSGPAVELDCAERNRRHTRSLVPPEVRLGRPSGHSNLPGLWATSSSSDPAPSAFCSSKRWLHSANSNWAFPPTWHKRRPSGPEAECPA